MWHSPPPKHAGAYTSLMPHPHPPIHAARYPPSSPTCRQPTQKGGGSEPVGERHPPSCQSKNRCLCLHQLPYVSYLETNSPHPNRHHCGYHTSSATTKNSLYYPPSSPYLAFKTQYHNLSFSLNICQHHFPNNEILNSHNRRTPKPPFSFSRQTEFQATHEIKSTKA